jgi:hypothetical protein
MKYKIEKLGRHRRCPAASGASHLYTEFTCSVIGVGESSWVAYRNAVEEIPGSHSGIDFKDPEVSHRKGNKPYWVRILYTP